MQMCDVSRTGSFAGSTCDNPKVIKDLAHVAVGSVEHFLGRCDMG